MAFKIGKTEFAGRQRGKSYELSINYTDINGVSQRDQYTVRNVPQNLTERELEKYLINARTKRENALTAGVTTGKTPSFAELSEMWYNNVAVPNFALQTYQRQANCKQRIYKALGKIKIDKINYNNVQNFLNSLIESDVNKIYKNQGLSYGTIRNYRNFIMAVLNYAVDCNYIAFNPCFKTKIPKNATKKRSNFNMFSEEELITFKELLNDPKISLKMRVFFNILMCTGARKGEILGLQFNDLVGNQLHFDRSIIKDIETNEIIISHDMKTPNSHRYNVIPDEVVALIHELEIEQAHNKEQFGEDWLNTRNAMFTGLYGGELDIQYPLSWLNRLVNKHPDKLHKVTIHSFRHLFVSALVSSGYSITEIASIVGDTPALVSKTYMHFFEKREKSTISPAYDLPIFCRSIVLNERKNELEGANHVANAN